VESSLQNKNRHGDSYFQIQASLQNKNRHESYYFQNCPHACSCCPNACRTDRSFWHKPSTVVFLPPAAFSSCFAQSADFHELGNAGGPKKMVGLHL
jgi:hypothetical protein